MYDCGAWSYREDEKPRYTVDECINEYLKYAKDKDVLISPDHMILKNQEEKIKQYRLKVTMDNAEEFIRKCPSNFIPMAANQGDLETRKK
jgi:hypothetical protein